MTDRIASGAEVSSYVLRLAGHLDDHWHDWVADLTMTHEPDGTTTLQGPCLDQAALHGLLTHVRDLGATVVAVTLVTAADAELGPPRP